MKVKDLIKKLEKEDQNAIVCNDNFLDFKEVKSYSVINVRKKTKTKHQMVFNGKERVIDSFEVESYTPSNSKKKAIVFRTY